jgi:two-component sensor histidine kinase
VITNAIKYAFDKDSTGVITVSLFAADNDSLRLTVSDNGKGLPDKFNAFESNSLGMSLVTGLVTQLEGSLKFLNDGGVKMIIVFPYNKVRMDPSLPEPAMAQVY